MVLQWLQWQYSYSNGTMENPTADEGCTPVHTWHIGMSRILDRPTCRHDSVYMYWFIKVPLNLLSQKVICQLSVYHKYYLFGCMMCHVNSSSIPGSSLVTNVNVQLSLYFTTLYFKTALDYKTAWLCPKKGQFSVSNDLYFKTTCNVRVNHVLLVPWVVLKYRTTVHVLAYLLMHIFIWYDNV